MSKVRKHIVWSISRNCPRTKISMISAICISLCVVLGPRSVFAQQAQRIDRVPVLINTVDGTSEKGIGKAINLANRRLQNAGAHIRLYVAGVQTVDIGENGNLSEGDQAAVLKKGKKELKDLFGDTGIGNKMFLVKDCWVGKPNVNGWAVQGTGIKCIEINELDYMVGAITHEEMHAVADLGEYPKWMWDSKEYQNRIRNQMMIDANGRVIEHTVLTPDEIQALDKGARKRSNGFYWAKTGCSVSPPTTDTNDGHGSILDDTFDQYCEKPDFDPCDPNFGYTDLDVIEMYVGNWFDPNDTVIVTIWLRGLFPNAPLLFDEFIRMHISRGDPNCDPGIFLHTWRDANDPIIRSEGTWENCDPCFSRPIPVDISVSSISCIENPVPFCHYLQVSVPASLFFDSCNPANEPLVTAMLEVNDPRVGCLITDKTDKFKFGRTHPVSDSNRAVPVNPFLDAFDMSPVLNLTWTSGVGATSHDVYFGTVWRDVNDANTSSTGIYRGRQGANTYDPCTLELGNTYFWRIDEVNDPNIYKGDVWTFTTDLGTAMNPSPLPGTMNVNQSVILSWARSVMATSQDVYFGTDRTAVENADTTDTSGVFRCRQTASEVNYDPPEQLQLQTTYYWRIDEVNVPNIWKGDVWSLLPPMPADFIYDGVIDYGDLSVLVNNWLLTPTDPNIDLHYDGKIDFQDFAEFGKYWGEEQVWPSW